MRRGERRFDAPTGVDEALAETDRHCTEVLGEPGAATWSTRSVTFAGGRRALGRLWPRQGVLTGGGEVPLL